MNSLEQSTTDPAQREEVGHPVPTTPRNQQQVHAAERRRREEEDRERRERQEREDRELALRLSAEMNDESDEEEEAEPITPPPSFFTSQLNRRSIPNPTTGTLRRSVLHPGRPMSDDFNELQRRLIPLGSHAMTPEMFMQAIMGLGSMDEDELHGATYEDLLNLDREAVRVGVPQNVLESFPTFKYKKRRGEEEEEQMQCAICLDELNDEDEVRRIPCMHVFHTNCIDRWLQDHKKCPVCNYEINTS